MVLLHGVTDNAHVWDHFAPYASDRFRVIALDQRGHGDSDWAVPPAYSCEDYCSDLSGLIADLQLNGIILVGHSMGALHALKYTYDNPENVSGLIYVDIEPSPPSWNRTYLHELFDTQSSFYDSIEEFVGRVQKTSPYANKDIISHLAHHYLLKRNDGKFYITFDREVLKHFDQYRLHSCLSGIQCPTLIIRGEDSLVMRREIAREMNRSILKSRLIEIPRAAHPVLTDNPLQFRHAVMDFLINN
jgi:esterase